MRKKLYQIMIMSCLVMSVYLKVKCMLITIQNFTNI